MCTVIKVQKIWTQKGKGNEKSSTIMASEFAHTSRLPQSLFVPAQTDYLSKS